MLEVIKLDKTYNIRISGRALLAAVLIASAGIASVGAVMTSIVLTKAQTNLARLAAEVDMAKREIRHTELEISRTCGATMYEREKL